MNNHPGPETVTAIRTLYEQDSGARRLFDWVASLQRDATETSIDLIGNKVNISRGEAVSLARKLEDAGCGDFIVGRRGSLSRFKWKYSRISLGHVASGETEDIEEAHDPIREIEDEDEGEVTQDSKQHLTIHQAKVSLAESLGLEPSQIGIEIRA